MSGPSSPRWPTSLRIAPLQPYSHSPAPTLGHPRAIIPTPSLAFQLSPKPNATEDVSLRTEHVHPSSKLNLPVRTFLTPTPPRPTFTCTRSTPTPTPTPHSFNRTHESRRFFALTSLDAPTTSHDSRSSLRAPSSQTTPTPLQLHSTPTPSPSPHPTPLHRHSN